MSGIDIRWGQVWLVTPAAVTWLPPENTDPGEASKGRRRIVVVSDDKLNQTAGWPFVLGIPITKNEEHLTPLCVKFPKGGAFDVPCAARTAMLQPFMKRDLEDMVAPLKEDQQKSVRLAVAQYLGFIKPPSPPAGDAVDNKIPAGITPNALANMRAPHTR